LWGSAPSKAACSQEFSRTTARQWKGRPPGRPFSFMGLETALGGGPRKKRVYVKCFTFRLLRQQHPSLHHDPVTSRSRGPRPHRLRRRLHMAQFHGAMSAVPFAPPIAPPADLKLFRPQNPYIALGLAVNHLMTKPAFANLRFGDWSRILTGQI